MSINVNKVKRISDLQPATLSATHNFVVDSAASGGQRVTASNLKDYINEANIVTVTGATPTITGASNTRYVCGEVTSISITPPASGTIDVVFTSGSMVTVMTVPNTVKFPAWFDAANLDTNTIYEVNIMDGVYGAVMSWQV